MLNLLRWTWSGILCAHGCCVTEYSMTTNIQPRLIGNDWLKVEMETTACISAHLQKPTDTYSILHCIFQVKQTLEAVLLFPQIKITGADNQLIKTYFCVVHCTILCSNIKTLLPYCINKCILMFASHNQLHIYGFSDIVNLLSSSPGIALHLNVEPLGTSPCESSHFTKELKAS